MRRRRALRIARLVVLVRRRAIVLVSMAVVRSPVVVLPDRQAYAGRDRSHALHWYADGEDHDG